ncbi:MAG: hypothetical protein JWP72_3129 [Massilia sp.]|nr:hypothetical protein [Massilia sp.]
MIKPKQYSSSLAAAAVLLASPCATAQDQIPIELPEQTNQVGLGVFGVPDYYGSSKNDAVVAPLLRYSWDGTSYIQLLGTEVLVNLSPLPEFRAGPVLRVRPRRDDDVDDGVVGLMRPIPSATELGVFAAYHLRSTLPGRCTRWSSALTSWAIRTMCTTAPAGTCA